MATPSGYRQPESPPAYDVRPRLESEQEYFTEIALQESRRWIEAVTQKQFRYPADPRRSLQDGILLCELLMKLKPGCIRKVNRLPSPIAGLDNLTLFQNCCREQFGLQDCQLFDIRDLDDLRLRVIVESDEAEEELQCETFKRLRNVVITIFWLGKLTRGKFSGPSLDLAAFSNLVDVPMTPLSRSEYSSPSGSTVFLPQEPPEPSEDGFFRYRGATLPWNQQGSAPTRYDSMDQPARIETVPQPTADAPGSVVVAASRPGRFQRPNTLTDANRPDAYAAPNSTDRATMVAERQISAPTMASPVFCSGVSVVRPTAGATADPLRYVKSDTSPLAEEARQTIDHLQQQKQQNRQLQAERDTDSWETNLSSWKSRWQSQRKSDEQDDGLTTAVSTRVTTTSSQNRATEQLTNEIEDMVLSAFGFTRASQQQQQHQQPSAVVRSTDLVPAGRPTSNTQQSTAIQSAPDTSIKRSNNVQVSTASMQLQSEPQAKVTQLRSSTKQHAEYSAPQPPSTGNDVTGSCQRQPPEVQQADFEDIVVLMEARPEHQIGLDFTLHGGRERGPIVVTSVEPGGSAEHCGLKSGDELVAVNGAPLSEHYLESVIAVIDQVIHQGPLEFSVRRYHTPPTQKPRLPSAEKTPPPLPDAPPPPLPAAQPPRFPIEEAFTVEGGDDWTFIDDDFSRDLDNILEEDPESGPETGYVSGDTGYNRGVTYSSDDDASMRPASLRKRNEFLEFSADVSEERRTFEADERQTAGSKSSISAESSRMSSDKGKSSSDERAFAVISTPKSSLQPVSDQFTVAAVQVVDKRQIDRGDQSKPSVKLEPKVVRVTQEDSSVAAGQAMTRGPEGKLPVQTDRQKQQREVKVDQKPIESSKPELASRKPVPVSRTDPAHLHKLVSQRIEQTLSSKQEEFSTTNTTHEVRTQYSKSPVSVESTTASATVQKDQSGTQRARLGSDPAENVSTEQRKEREAAEKTRTDVRQVRELWLASRESKNTETASDGSRLVGRLEKPKMWRSVEHLRSLSLSCAPEDSSITERVSRDMESTLKYQPKSTDSPSSRVAFNLEEERKRMAEWTAEQERIRKERFDQEQTAMRTKRELDVEKARKAEEEKRKEKEQLVARENARQKELEEVAKRRQDELKAKLAKAGVVPLEMERKMDRVPDCSSRASGDVNPVKSAPVIKVQFSTDEEWQSSDSEVKFADKCDVHLAKSDASSSDGDFVTAEVMFSEVRPQTGQFEIIPSDSDEPTSSECGTPVPRRITLVREDLQDSGTAVSSARAGSRSPMNVVEVCGVKSSESSQWRKEAMKASKPRPSGWLWVDRQQNSDGTNSSSERLAGTSSPGSSDDLQHDRRDRCSPTMTPSVQPVAAKSPEGLPKTVERPAEARMRSLLSESQQVPGDWPDYGSTTADGVVYRSTTTTELTPPKHQTSPRISPVPEPRRVLTPPTVKAGDMPFISDRTFPVPASSNGSGGLQPQPTVMVGGSPSPTTGGLSGSGSCPRSPTGTSKPPPPPRTVSVKSPEVLKSSQASDSYEMMRSYSQSSSSESSKVRHSERFSNTARSYEYSEQFETSKNYHDFNPDDTAKTHTVPLRLASSPSPRHVAESYSSSQYSEYPATSPSGREADDVGQSTTVVGTEPAAVDALFSYHQMTQNTGDGQFSTSTFNSRCSPAVTPQTQPVSAAPSRSTIHQTHYV